MGISQIPPAHRSTLNRKKVKYLLTSILSLLWVNLCLIEKDDNHLKPERKKAYRIRYNTYRKVKRMDILYLLIVLLFGILMMIVEIILPRTGIMGIIGLVVVIFALY